MQKFDYIVSGGGAAGLSLIVHMIQSGKFADKRILLVEKDVEKSNDRTWCFWEQSAGLFEPVVYRSYSKLWFHTNDYSSLNDITPYTYKLIRGIDFYQYCLSLIQAQSNIEVLHGNVQELDSVGGSSYVVVNGKQIFADYIFNSIIFEKPRLKTGEYYLLQHFVGWIIKTASPVFNLKEATIMDFRVDQKHGTTFFYVMPFSSTEALIEYTFFSPAILPPEEYDTGLRKYISNQLAIGEYEIIDVERGSIPMTNVRFPRYKNNIVNIGTAGGDTKPSSGYTFRFIQKQCAKIVEALDQTGKPFVEEAVADKRFFFYDSTLLNILYNRKVEGDYIFKQLFRYNDMRTVLQFLDNETTLTQELKLISVLPKIKFMKAAMTQFI